MAYNVVDIHRMQFVGRKNIGRRRSLAAPSLPLKFYTVSEQHRPSHDYACRPIAWQPGN